VEFCQFTVGKLNELQDTVSCKIELLISAKIDYNGAMLADKAPDYIILLNEKLLQDDANAWECVFVLLHEVRHVFQHVVSFYVANKDSDIFEWNHCGNIATDDCTLKQKAILEEKARGIPVDLVLLSEFQPIELDADSYACIETTKAGGARVPYDDNYVRRHICEIEESLLSIVYAFKNKGKFTKLLYDFINDTAVSKGCGLTGGESCIKRYIKRILNLSCYAGISKKLKDKFYEIL